MKEIGIRMKIFLFRPITARIKVRRLERSGRTGTKAEKPTKEIVMKSTKEKKLKRSFVVQLS